jgi:hypothetical protein
MMPTRKRTRPALYELMKGQRIYSPSQQIPAERSTNHELDDGPSAPKLSWLDRLRAGHSMRIPVGYIFLGIPAVLLIVVVAYIFGFSRGETGSPTDSDGATPDFAVNDPLARPLLSEPGNPTTDTAAHRAGSNTQPTGDSSSRLSFDMSKLGPITSDPRVKGVRYYVISTTVPEGAERLASFCRENGLPAFVVNDPEKASRRRVIVLPGFVEPTSHPEVQSLRNRILDVGQKWKEVDRSSDDLSGCFASTYNG